MPLRALTATNHAFAMEVVLELGEDGCALHVFNADTHTEYPILQHDTMKKVITFLHPCSQTTYTLHYCPKKKFKLF